MTRAGKREPGRKAHVHSWLEKELRRDFIAFTRVNFQQRGRRRTH